MVKPAGRKKYRRGRNKSKFIPKSLSENKCILYHLNCRGLHSKRKSLESVVEKLSPAIITLNETALKFKQKPNLKNYVSHDKNRISEAMGGVSTLAMIKDKDKFTKICEGNQKDEFLITRHTNFLKPLNVMNIYGEQESRCSKVEVAERWERILAEIMKITRRNELLLIIGDLNKHIGNDELGVTGNH